MMMIWFPCHDPKSRLGRLILEDEAHGFREVFSTIANESTL